MLSAAEAALEQGATDDAERQRIRDQLYRPPAGETAARAGPGQGMTRAAAQALMARLAAEDGQFAAGR
ncbi:hypothetical protein [Streptomyces sp. NPDC087272]|uniref:hypothetical protein n=1 Tax=Streptomyces sp. NPDC087272 TaxID=3365775 RepID=UPI0038188AC2